MTDFVVVYEMLRQQQKVADVVTLSNGKCVVSWPNSTIVYDSEDAARGVHIDHMRGRGEKTEFRFVWASHDDVLRGINDCAQDACENVPFASIGGLEARDDPRPPNYDDGVPLTNTNAYLFGYTATARAMFGADWRTCEFGWAPAMVITEPLDTPPDQR